MAEVPEIDAWWRYTRPATYDTVVTPVMVPMADGTRLQCDLSRPARDGQPVEGRFPGLVVELTPYALARPLWNQEAEWFAARGYNALVGNLRGTGGSEGTWQHAMASQDGRDARDLVEWLAEQPFSDGRIGQFGESYGGQTSYGAAIERAPHLRAIAPMQAPSNLYDDVIYPGGIKSTERGTIDSWPPIAELISDGGIDADAEYAVGRAHPTFDDYWRDRAHVGRLDQIEVPVLAVGGWPDQFFRSGALTAIEGALDRTWAFYGPWPHLPPASFEDPPADGQLPAGVLLAWFDRWVMDLDDVPIPTSPTFASFEGPDGTGAGWRVLPAWTPEGTDAMTWTLGGDLAVDQDSPVAGVAFHQPGEPDEPGASCAFTSAPLDVDRVLVGWPVLTFDAMLTAPDAHFYAELLDVEPDGTGVLVNDGFLLASHRTSHVTPRPIEPGERERYEIRIRAHHHRFAAGHCVRVRLSGAPSQTLEPVEPPVDVTIHLDGATLRLPGFAAPDPD
jgi:predicted acyl esterase